ncbi:hypothetical protein GQ457_09G019450 [Hibiscus cannabinus]
MILLPVICVFRIHARNDQPGRIRKQQYLEFVKAEYQPRFSAPADKQSIERDCVIISIFLSISLFYERIRKKAEI